MYYILYEGLKLIRTNRSTVQGTGVHTGGYLR